MGYKFNPLIYSGFDMSSSGGSGGGGSPLFKDPVDTEGDLPGSADDGEVRVVKSTDHIYVYDGTTSQWVDTGLTESTFGNTPNVNGYDIDTALVSGIRRNILVLQPADAVNPGGVSVLDQSFTGIKSFETEVRLPYASDASFPVRLNANKGLISGAIDLSNADTVGSLDAARIGTGDVDNIEFSYLNGVTSPIQTQLNDRLLKSSGDINETFFQANKDVNTPSDITGFTFAATVRSFEAQVSVIYSDDNLYEVIKLIGVNKNGSWQIYSQELGDDSLVDFFITSGGQVQYTSGSYSGLVGPEIKFRALTLND